MLSLHVKVPVHPVPLTVYPVPLPVQPAVAVAGGIRAMTPKANYRGPRYRLAGQNLSPLGPLAEVNFQSGFRTLRDGSGPQGRIIWIRETDQGPADRIRAPKNGPGFRKMKQGPKGRIRAC